MLDRDIQGHELSSRTTCNQHHPGDRSMLAGEGRRGRRADRMGTESSRTEPSRIPRLRLRGADPGCVEHQNNRNSGSDKAGAEHA